MAVGGGGGGGGSTEPTDPPPPPAYGPAYEPMAMPSVEFSPLYE